MLCECGRPGEARPLLEVARRADFHHAAYDWTWLTTTTLWAGTAAWLADPAAAGLLYERLSPYEAQGISTGGTNFTGTVGMYLARLAGVLGEYHDALRLFERADAQLRSLQAPPWQAHNQIEWARLLSTSSSDTDLLHARQLLHEATTTAVTYGCAGIEQRANELAGAL